MNMDFSITRNVVVDDQVYGVYVQPACGDIGGN